MKRCNATNALTSIAIKALPLIHVTPCAKESAKGMLEQKDFGREDKNRQKNRTNVDLVPTNGVTKAKCLLLVNSTVNQVAIP